LRGEGKIGEERGGRGGEEEEGESGRGEREGVHVKR
jgi:hypothetical protein